MILSDYKDTFISLYSAKRSRAEMYAQTLPDCIWDQLINLLDTQTFGFDHIISLSYIIDKPIISHFIPWEHFPN